MRVNLKSVIEKLDSWRAFDPQIGWSISAVVMVGHVGIAYFAKNSGWISAGGALVIVIGVLTIARALIRQGDDKVMRTGRTFARLMREVDGQLVSAQPEVEAQQYEDARAEFQHGPGLVIVGTLINGYGALLAAPLI